MFDDIDVTYDDHEETVMAGLLPEENFAHTSALVAVVVLGFVGFLSSVYLFIE